MTVNEPSANDETNESFTKAIEVETNANIASNMEEAAHQMDFSAKTDLIDNEAEVDVENVDANAQMVETGENIEDIVSFQDEFVMEGQTPIETNKNI